MTAAEIRKQITKVPFRPFTLHMADGQTIRVHARDFILVSPLGLTVDVYQADDDHDILDMALITSISFDPPAQPSAPQTTDTNA